MSPLERLLGLDPLFLARMIGHAAATRGLDTPPTTRGQPPNTTPYKQPYTADRFMQELMGGKPIGPELPRGYATPAAQSDLEAYLAEQQGHR